MALTAAIGSAVGAIGGLGLGAYNASQQSGIASEQESLAAQQQQQSSIVFGEQQGYAKMLNDLISNPSSVTSLPGYQFNLDQGTQAVSRQMAAGQNLGSTAEGIALTQYGQNYASSAYTTQAQLLASLAGLNVNPTSGLSGASSSLSGASAANNATFNQVGSLLASAGYSNATNNSWWNSNTNTTPANPTGANSGNINMGGYIVGLPTTNGGPNQ